MPADPCLVCGLRCHLALDRDDNLARKRERRAAADGQHPLPLLAVMPEHRR